MISYASIENEEGSKSTSLISEIKTHSTLDNDFLDEDILLENENFHYYT